MTEEHNTPRGDDRRIGVVLHALTHAEPDGTMQARLVASLRTAGLPGGAQTGAARLRWAAPLTSGSLPYRLAMAVCLLTLAGACLHHTALQYGAHFKSRPVGTVASTVSQPGGDRSATTAEAGRLAVPAQRGHSSTSTAVPKLESSATRALMDSLHPATASPGSGRTHSHAAETVSIAPPPLPLTEQERLLLRLGRQAPAEQLATLTLPARNAAFQREKDAVTEFFAPAPPLRSQASPDPPSEPAGQP